SANEREALREYIDEMERLGKIRRSSAPCSSPIMFVKKADGSLRPVVDYRALNKITVKDRTPLPLMDEIRDRVLGSKIFTRLDLKSGFNLIRIKEGHEWLTAFSTHLGLYEYLVMPFGLTNAPAIFQRMVNDILADLIDRGVVLYLDDILIYSENTEDHQRLVSEVLARLHANGLAVNPKKSEFHKRETKFLGYLITPEGVQMDREK